MARHKWKKGKYKSGLEWSVAKSMEAQKIEFRYEPTTIQYRKRVVKGVCDACGGDKTSQRRTYLPDFVLGRTKSGEVCGSSIYIETKGFFSPADRAKMVAVKQDNPGLDIRLIFGANNKLNKKKNERYSDWAEKHGFPYFIGSTFPPAWV